MENVLIEKVKEYDVLYNSTLPEYRNQHIRRAAWNEIGDALQTTGCNAKERWDRLRRCFSNARNRRRTNVTNGMSALKKCDWKYEKNMSFILPFLDCRKHPRNIKASPMSPNFEMKLEGLSEMSDSEEMTPYKWENDNESVHDHEFQSNQDIGDFEKPDENDVTEENTLIEEYPVETITQKFEVNDPLRKQNSSDFVNSTKTSKETTISLENLDSMDLFFLSMSRMAKQLPKIVQTQIKRALSNSVLGAEERYNQQFHENTIHQQFRSVSPNNDQIG